MVYPWARALHEKWVDRGLLERVHGVLALAVDSIGWTPLTAVKLTDHPEASSKESEWIRAGAASDVDKDATP